MPRGRGALTVDSRVLRREFAAVTLMLVAVFVAGAITFQRVPSGGHCLDAVGAFGPIGTWARCALVASVGVPGAALVALGCLALSLSLFGRLQSQTEDTREWGFLVVGVVLLVPIAIGLALGGVGAAPLAAWLSKRIPVRPFMVFVGLLVVCLSTRNLLVAFHLI